ncbi:MAG TPA: hypothetical protein VFU19_16045 [Iamia sp.]|nr:hypothetical protein [Iamia sp.]
MCTTVAVLPAVVAVVQMLRRDWAPIADDGIILLRAHDVLSGDTPALGQLSIASFATGADTRSMGPAAYWPFALTARFGPMWLTPVLAGVLSALGLALIVHLAGRRGGLPLMASTTVGLVLVLRAVGTVNLAEVWNPSVALVPMVLLLFLGWSLGSGERGWLPLTVLVASFVAQAHITYVVAALGMLVVSVAAGYGPLALALWRRRRGGEDDDAPVLDTRVEVRRLGLAVAVAGVLWALPLAQQLRGDPGNITLLSRSTSDGAAGWWFSARVIARSVGVIPVFLRDMPDSWGFYEHLPGEGWSLATATTLLVVLALGAVVVVAGRRRSDLAVAAALVLVALAGALVTLRSTPSDHRIFSVLYTGWWVVAYGMLAWLVLLAVGLRIGARAGAARTVPAWVRPAGAGLAVAVAAAVALSTPVHDREAMLYPLGDEVADAVVAEGVDGQAVMIEGGGGAGVQMGPAIAYRVHRAGGRPVLAGYDGRSAGPDHVGAGRRCDAVIRIAADHPPEPAVAGERTLLVAPVPPNPEIEAERLYVTIAPDTAAPSC